MVRLPLLVLTLLFALAPIARADGPQLAAAAAAAAETLAAQSNEATKAGRRPAFDQPPAVEQLARIFDTQGLLALSEPKASDIQWLFTWSGAAAKGLNILMVAGARSNSQADQIAAMERNIDEYEDALFQSWIFMARLQARMILTGDLFVQSLPPSERTEAHKRGVEDIRSGHITSIQGALTTIAAGVKPENARQMAATLRDIEPIWTKRLTSEERERIQFLLSEARKKYQDPAVLDLINRLARSVANPKPI